MALTQSGLALTYSFLDVDVLMGGIPITGFSGDTAVTLTPTSEQVSTVVGVDGVAQMSVLAVGPYTAALSLMQTSPSNQTLQDFWAADQTSRSGKTDFLVKDTLGTTKFYASAARVQQVPTAGFAGEAGTWEWTVVLIISEINYGYNS